MDWLWMLFEICNAFFEVLMMKTLAEGFLKNKRSIPKYLGILVFVSVVALSFAASMGLNGNFHLLATKSILLTMLISFTFCQSKVLWHGIVAVTYYLFLAVSEFIGMYAISFVHGIHFTEMIEFGVYRYQAIVIIDIISFLFIKLICRFRKEEAHRIPFKLWSILCFLPVFSVVILLQMIIVSSDERKSATFLSVLSVLSLLFINVLIFYIIESVVRQAVNRERIAAMEVQLALQKEHNRRFMENRAHIQRLSHDFKQHVQVFGILSEQGKYAELTERIKELSRQQSQHPPMPDTGNLLLDALLAAKRDIAEKNGIQWICNTQIPPDMPISMLELCGIMGNALDNAIEACLRTEHRRFVSLDMRSSDNVLLIEIKNTMGQRPKMKAGRILTSKENAKHHGIGLRSMDEGCRKLGGRMSWVFNETAFEVHILIPF